MSSCLSGGGGRAVAYGFELEIVKSLPSTSTTTRATSNNTPSPSSTLSESDSSLAISTRKPRTPRKRPKETYNEAAALLSTAYPNIFSPTHSNAKKSPSNSQYFSIKSPLSGFDETSELLLPFESMDEIDFLFHPPLQALKVRFFEEKEVNFGGRSSIGGEMDYVKANRSESFDDFDTESILDEEVEEGIDSIMGNGESNEENHRLHLGGNRYGIERLGQMMMNPWYGSFMEFGIPGNFKLGYGLKSALRDNDDANWWRFPTVEFEQISPRIQSSTNAKPDSAEKKTTKTAVERKKKKKVSSPAKSSEVESKSSESGKEDQNVTTASSVKSAPLLKLDYDSILKAWSDKALPFPDEIPELDCAGADVHARVEKIELFGEGGIREASVLRYKEKRKTRLLSNSKKIRYQVRKLNADQRPRIKGRFVRRPNASNPSGHR